MRTLLALAGFSLSLAVADAANFPYIRLNGKTNVISDNGTNLTYNGSALSGGAPTYPSITNAMSWSGNTNNVIGGDGKEIPRIFGLTYQPGDTNTYATTLTNINGLILDVENLSAGNSFALRSSSYTSTSTSNQLFYMFPLDLTLGGMFIGLENSGGGAPFGAGSASVGLFHGSYNGTHTNHMAQGSPMWNFTGGHTVSVGVEEALDTDEQVFGVNNDFSTLFAFMVVADNPSSSNGYGKIGINTNTPTAALEVSAWNSSIPAQKWSRSDGTQLASITYDGDLTVGSTNAWKLGGVTNGLPNVQVNSANYTLQTSQALTTLTPLDAGTYMDFSGASRYWSCTLTGSVSLVITNNVANQQGNVLITGVSTNANLTFPSNWIFIGYKPTYLTANKHADLYFKSTGTGDTNIWAYYGEQQ